MFKGLFTIITFSLLLCAGISSAQKTKDQVRIIKTDTIPPVKSLPSAQKLQEVKIKGKRALVSKTSVSVTLSSTDLEKSRGSTLAEALVDITGVNVLKTGSTIAKPVIHGLHSNRILLLNNGVRLESQQWGVEHAPEIDPFIAEQIHVVKGAESIKYGAEAIGGIVIVEPPVLPQRGGLSGSMNLIGATNGRSGTTSAMLSGGLNKLPGFGWRLQGTAKKGGNIKTADYYLGNTGVREMNFSAAAGYQAKKSYYEAFYSQFSTELGILYSAHIGTIEDINARIAIGRPLEGYDFQYAITAPRQQIIHHLLKLKGHYDLSENRRLDLIYAYQKNHRKEFDFRRGNREAIPMTDLILNTHNIDLKLNVPKDNGRRSYGINGVMQVNNNIPGTLANTFIPNFDSFSAGAFIIQHWIKEKYELEAGIRYDYKYFDAAGFRYTNTTADNDQQDNAEQYYGGQNSFHNITGSFGATWKFSHNWQAVSNAGLAWRAPTANELYSNGLHHGAGLFEIGNPEIKNEKGYKWITTVKYSSASLTANLDAYVQYISNYIYSKPDLSFKQTVSGTYPIFRYAQTNAVFTGADFSGKYLFNSSLSYQLNASVIRAKDQTAKKYLPYIPAGRISHLINYNFLLNALSETYLQFGHTYVGKQTRFEPESDYAIPPSAYHLFKAAAGTTMKIKQQTITVHLSAENLFNTLYKDYMNRYRYYTHDMGRNLTLRLAYKF